MISVRDVPQLRAVVLSMRMVERDVVNLINRETRAVLGPIWKEAVNGRATRPMDRRILATGARVKPGNPPVVMAATSTRPIHRRLVPADQWHAWEFGADREDVTTYDRKSPKGTVHTVTRHTKRQLPPRYRKGRVIYPAFDESAKRMAQAWVQTVVRAVRNAAEGRNP